MRQLFASVLLIPLLACSTRMGDLTIATTKNLPQKFEMVGNEIEGKDCANMFLFIPIGVLNPSIEGALDDALEKVPEADAMVDATIHQTTLFTLLFNQNCFRIKGSPIKTR